MKTLQIIYQRSSNKLKLDFFIILFLSITNSSLEVFGLGILVPIFSIINDFENFKAFINNYSNFTYFLKDLTQYELLTYFLLLFLIIFFLKYTNYFYLNRLTINFAANYKIFLSNRIFYSYSSQNYSFFQNKNSSILLRDLFIEVNAFCDRYVLCVLNTFIEITFVVLVLIFLLFQETILIITFIIYFAPLSLIFYLLIKKKIEIAAFKRNEIDEKKLYIVKNFLGNIKVIKTQNKEVFFINLFNKYITNFEFTFANFNFIKII